MPKNEFVYFIFVVLINNKMPGDNIDNLHLIQLISHQII